MNRKLKYFIAGLAIAFAALVLILNNPELRRIFEKDTAWQEEEEEGKGKNNAPSDWFYRQRAYPQQEINMAAYHAAYSQAQELRSAYSQTDEVVWSEAGPSNIGGRVTAIGVHPSAPSTIYIGAADGGVLKSTNGGSTWAPVFDAVGALSIGAITMDPNNANTIWVGTGEANAAGDNYPGNGIYRSTNAGSTWDFMGLPNSDHIGRIAIDPTNSQRIFAAVCGSLWLPNPDRGLYRTLNGGTTWDRVLYRTDSTAAIDVVINPQNPLVVYAAMWEVMRHPNQRRVGGMTSGIWRSTNGGDTWTQLTNGLPGNSATVGRIGLTIHQANPNIMYALYANDPGNVLGVWKTTNGGDSWTQLTTPSQTLYNGYGWYFGNIVVDPVDPQKVFALGMPLYRSTNGGSSWSDVSGIAHVDHHALWINPNNTNQVYNGNDGGFYTSTNGGSVWTKSYNLHISQFYAIDIDFLNPNRLYGGTQDNGTLRTLTGNLNDWTDILGGDGFYAVVDFTNSNIIYAEYQYGALKKSSNGGSSFSSCLSGVTSSDRRNWCTPVVMDPNNHAVLYYGTYRLYKTTNSAGGWTAISTDLTDGNQGGTVTFNTITTISVSPLNGQVIYVGTDDGNVWVTQNGGTSWTPIYANLPDRWITRVLASSASMGTAYVTLSGYRTGDYLAHVFRTTNYGGNWTDVSGNLPEGPVNAIVEDPLHTDRLVVSTDMGVFYTDNLGSNWQPLGIDLPICAAVDLKLHSTTRALVVGTHGRSMYKTNLDSLPSAPPNVTVTITPFNPPIQIPAPGGSFQYDINVHNATTVPVSMDIWVMMKLLPNGSWTGPYLNANRSLPGGANPTRTRTQNIAGSLQAGSYLYEGRVGIYPNTIWSYSNFTFTKSATGQGTWVNDFTNSGDDFEDWQPSATLPQSFKLESNFPDPFNASTTIRFSLPQAERVRLSVYDEAGRLVRNLMQGQKAAGVYEVNFNAANLASGVYFARLEAGGFTATERMVLLK
ncbi:MAG: T9SS type A sorting domain-containing protein [bacterium]|nr:T9SS type A sorting domain-containing protein [bacterium]